MSTLQKQKGELLLVDDDEKFVTSLNPQLSDLGIKITWVKKSHEAFSEIEKRIKSQQPQFSLIVLDINLEAYFAKLDAEEGVALLSELRKIGFNSPVIANTG
jgi:ActR/RegA family two-component response regulator